MRVQPARPRRRQPTDPLQRLGGEGRHDGPLETRSAAGREDVDRAAPRVALQLDVEERAARDDRQHLLERRHAMRGELVRAEVGDATGRSLDAVERLVVDDDRDAVLRRPDVELEPVAARHVERGQERGDRVLGRAPPVAAVRETEGRQGSAALPDGELRGEPEVVAWIERAVPHRRSVPCEAGASDADAAADPDIVEAAGLAVGVHARRLESRRPRHVRIGAVRLGVRGSIARRAGSGRPPARPARQSPTTT